VLSRLFFIIFIVGCAIPFNLQAVSESEIQAKKSAIAEFFSEKFVVSTFQGFGNKRLSWGVISGDKTLPPIVISVGLGESYRHYEEFLYDLWSDGSNRQAVFIFDLRSQGFSERTSKDLTVMHVSSFDEYANDLEIFFDSIVRPDYPLPARVIGHSTGGLIALLVLAERPYLAEKVVFVAPLFGLNYGSTPSWIVEPFAGFLDLIGFHAKPIPFRGSSALSTFENNRLTSSAERFSRILEVRDIVPKPVALGPSVGFITSTQKALKKVNHLAEKFSLPAKLITADRDAYVNSEDAIALCKLMKDCAHTSIINSFHVMLQERDEIRDNVLGIISEYLLVPADEHRLPPHLTK